LEVISNAQRYQYTQTNHNGYHGRSIDCTGFSHPLPDFTAVPFLEYDPADIPILIVSFAYGPLAGLIVTITAALAQGFTC